MHDQAARSTIDMQDWTPNLATSDKPRYLAIADAIAEDIRSGRLSASDRLPPQRKLARRLDIDFTTVARGYLEAQKRGLIEFHVGRGTFVRSSARRRHSADGAPPGNRRPLDEPAARARRSGTARPHAGRLRSGRARPGFAAALPGLRRRAGRQGRGLELAEPPRPGAAPGPAVHHARARIRRCSASSACSPSRAT